MTAIEMFESLGYGCHKPDEKIEYSRSVEYIIFRVNEHEFYAGYCNEPKDITMDEFKAIQQQLKELGWI